MPFNKRTSNQDVLMDEVMSERELDPGMVKPEDFVIDGEDTAKKRRILKYTDNAGKSQLGLPTPDRNKARPSKSKS
jgi:hypothetical protein